MRPFRALQAGRLALSLSPSLSFPPSFSSCLSSFSFSLSSSRSSSSLAHLREVTYPIAGKKPRVLPADQAFSDVQSGQNIFAQGNAASPTPLLEALHRHAKNNNLRDIKLTNIFLQGNAPWLEKGESDHMRSNCLFIGGSHQKAVNEGRADYIPVLLSDIPRLFYTRTIPVDVAVIQVSPPDEHGYCSLGVSVEITRSALRCCSKIVALQNPRMPRTLGESLIHSSHIDVIVEADDNYNIYERKFSTSGDVEKKIGKLIAENLVDDGATLQMGIGGIPDSVLAALGNHRDLGIHSEMFSDGVLDLIESNVINNRLKTTFPGRIVVSFVFGTRRVYDFVHDNPLVHFGSVEWVNDPAFIRRQHKMVAINSAIEVDLTGQVVSDSIGSRFYSGFGGQIDFIRGSAIADDGMGKPIIAIPSINKNTGESKISAFIKQGSGVVTTRAHVHYVVTEYGIAQLWGKSVRQRAHSLINIAHPQHREQLEKDAFQRLKVMPSAD